MVQLHLFALLVVLVVLVVVAVFIQDQTTTVLVITVHIQRVPTVVAEERQLFQTYPLAEAQLEIAMAKEVLEVLAEAVTMLETVETLDIQAVVLAEQEL
jgi:hypothetical protein